MEKQSLRIKIHQVWASWWGWILFAIVLVVVVALLVMLVWTGVVDTGFGEYVPDPAVKPDPVRAKTLWDWMDLLLVPLLLALGAWLLNPSARAREHEAEERRIEEQRWIELDRSRGAALQTYLDRMTELITDGLLESKPDEAKRSIARARTVTMLRQLDGQRRDLLLRFLREAGLMEKEAVATLQRADLSKADLSRVDLSQAELEGINLSQANLKGPT